MTDARERACEGLADVIDEVVVRQAGISQASREDDEIGQKVGRAERIRVDVDGAKDARVRDAGEECRVERDDLHSR